MMDSYRQSAEPGPHLTGHRTFSIVIAEDNPADVRLIHEALHHHDVNAETVVHQDGEAMLRYVDLVDVGKAPCPDIVLLDLNLPKYNGHSVLQRLRSSSVCGHVPVVIVTSSNASPDRELAARNGATGYFRKPVDYDEFLRLGEVVKQFLPSRESKPS